MIAGQEPEGWRAECWPALYQQTLFIGVPWRLAVGQMMVGWVPFGFAIGHPFVCLGMGILSHLFLRKLHKGSKSRNEPDDPEAVTIAFRAIRFGGHWRV